MHMKELSTLKELQQEASSFIRKIAPRKDHATLITLSGDLGAGKTSFTQGAAKALGVTESVTSPTFVLQKTYLLQTQQFKELIHIDAYRLEGDNSLAPLRFSESYERPDALIILEWPERVAGQLPPPDHTLTFSVTESNTRTISYA